MPKRQMTFVFPGDINTRTGGYRYDKRIIEGLTEIDSALNAPLRINWQVSLMSLQGDYPSPTQAQLENAAAQLSTVPDGMLTVVDGLAFSVMPDIMAQHSERLTIVALIHHPLALETGLSESQSKTLKTLETQALRHAEHVITTSHLTAQSMVEYDVESEKITAILPGTDVAEIAAGSGSDMCNLLCVATLTPRKAHNILLDALHRLSDLDWHLYCAGSTDRNAAVHQQLLEQCNDLVLTENVSFTGELDDDELNAYYAQANLFVLASYHEGYGMVLTEAIARGLPIVCSDAGAMPQTVPDGAGILVPPGDADTLADALRSAISDDKVQTRLKNAALKAREELRSWEAASLEFSQTLDKLLKNTHGS